MGCDIHCFIEWKRKSYQNWYSFGEVDLDRNYRLFGLMAGVRDEPVMMFAPRGIPTDLSWTADREYWYPIADYKLEMSGDRSVTKELAQRYAAYGSVIKECEGQPGYVSDPDAHTPSWLTHEEYRKCVHSPMMDHAHPTHIAAMAAMDALCDEGRNEVRLVFWFDN